MILYLAWTDGTEHWIECDDVKLTAQGVIKYRLRERRIVVDDTGIKHATLRIGAERKILK